MKTIQLIQGPSQAGPGERRMMLNHAAELFSDAHVTETIRIDVPSRGDTPEAATMRSSVAPIIPALQSGSLFGDKIGVLIVDAQLLKRSEAAMIDDLLDRIDPHAAVVVFVSFGAMPAPLASKLKTVAETVLVKKLRARDADVWLSEELQRRRMNAHPEASQALLRKFGSDVAALDAALDQLAGADIVTVQEVNLRFANRPDEPIWLYGDAVSSGDVAQALRRLEDFLTHGHPLQLLAFLEGDLRRKAMAASAPNMDALSSWLGQSGYPVLKAWKARSSIPQASLAKALDALVRADRVLKTAPPETHQLTLERLTVALCRWYAPSQPR